MKEPADKVGIVKRLFYRQHRPKTAEIQISSSHTNILEVNL